MQSYEIYQIEKLKNVIIPEIQLGFFFLKPIRLVPVIIFQI